ncbi:hypothetical protein [Actinomadura sediminis]|uniref:Uncharacterized protein n=1 Tax=Actinomadura sediminis TaxID=1038904 RepID=A0ABW3EQ93_9ACTN
MSTWRQRLIGQHGEEARHQLRTLGEDTLDDDTHDTIIRQQWLDSVKSFSSDASLKEELQVRLSGNTTTTGSLDFKIGDALLKPLEDSISTAAKRDLELEIVGLSAGSTVLHVRATPMGISEDNADLMPDTGSSPADIAIRNFISLIKAAESGEDLHKWASAQWSLYRLVEALDRFDLALGLRWLSRTGTVRSSRLTSRGRQYVHTLHDLRDEKTSQIVRGRITELREAGTAKVKTGSSRNSPAYDVRIPKDALIGMHLELGQQVAFRVQVITKYDKLDNERSREYHFVELADTETSTIF